MAISIQESFKGALQDSAKQACFLNCLVGRQSTGEVKWSSFNPIYSTPPSPILTDVIDGIKYVAEKTLSGYVIQPEYDFQCSVKSGCWISQDFKTVVFDQNPQTMEAVSRIKTLIGRIQRW